MRLHFKISYYFPNSFTLLFKGDEIETDFIYLFDKLLRLIRRKYVVGHFPE